MATATPKTDVKTEPPVAQSPDELLAAIQRLQGQIDRLNAEKGIPSDPIEAGLKNIADHLRVWDNSHPGVDFSALRNDVDELVSDHKDSPISGDEAHLLREKVNAFIEDHPQIEHDLGYTKQLARDLYLVTLAG